MGMFIKKTSGCDFSGIKRIRRGPFIKMLKMFSLPAENFGKAFLIWQNSSLVLAVTCIVCAVFKNRRNVDKQLIDDHR